MSRDLSAILDIVEAVRLAREFTENMTRSDFLRDARTQWAVYSQVVLIGEAATRISEAFREAHPGIPWRAMIGMRHRLVHGYDQVQWDRVWETVAVNLPELGESLKSLVPRE